MGLGYALSENFTSTNGRPDSLLMRDCGILGAKDTPKIDVILIEVPDEVGGYGSKGVGEIGLRSDHRSRGERALHSYDGIRRFRLPMQDSPAAAPSVPKSRKKKTIPAAVITSATENVPVNNR
jgi:aldehyde oxidoreductase